MEHFLEVLMIMAISLFVIFLIVMFLWDLFSKEHPQKIHVVHKREARRRGKGSDGYYTRYTIDCTFPDADKLHTFDCEASVFRTLRRDKNYVVSVKRMSILSVTKIGWD